MATVRRADARARPPRLALACLLADGAWHPYYELLAHAMPLIPPEVGYRRGLAQARAPSSDRGIEHLTEVGRRKVVSQTLNLLRCEHRGPRGFAREYRLPGGGGGGRTRGSTPQ